MQEIPVYIYGDVSLEKLGDHEKGILCMKLFMEILERYYQERIKQETEEAEQTADE